MTDDELIEDLKREVTALRAQLAKQANDHAQRLAEVGNELLQRDWQLEQQRERARRAMALFQPMIEPQQRPVEAEEGR